MGNKYFDYSATALPNKKIIKRILNEYPEEYLFGNPSSTHYNGINAKKLLEKARESISQTLKCKPSEIIFTSGGTESDNLAIKGTMLQYSPGRAEMITSKIEHPAVLEMCKELEELGYRIYYLDCKTGYINEHDLDRMLNKNTRLVSIMAVNNEIGTIQPLQNIRLKTRITKTKFHTDYVQGVGILPIDVKNFDMASFSGHKFGALKGTGFLYKKESINLAPIIKGGGQERKIRSGTENVFGALVMAECLKQHVKKWDLRTRKRNLKLLNHMYDDLKQEFGHNIILNSNMMLGTGACNILNVSFRDTDSRTLQLLLADEGYSVSVGSACSSNKDEETSYVLKEINVPEDYQNGTIRISVNHNTTKEEIEDLTNAIIRVARRAKED